MGLFRDKTKWFKCSIMVMRGDKLKKCGRKFATLEQLSRHADNAHGGRAREV